MTYPSNSLDDCHESLHDFGFDRAAVLDLMKNAGIEIPVESNRNHTESTGAEISSKWGAALPLVEWLTVNDAACIFAGFHPRELEYCNYNEEPNEVADARQMFCDAADAGKIECDKDGYEGPIQCQQNHKLSHKSIRAWCAENGVTWPLSPTPGISFPHQDPSDIALRAATAEAKLSTLEKDLATASRELERVRQQLNVATDSLVVATAEARQLKEKNETLAADLLLGKSKNTALLLIGGMAIDAYGMPIHSNRITGISDLLNTLAGHGVTLGEDAVRNVLKAASEIIPPPKP